MTVYGKFEAIKKIHTSHHGSIFSARTAGTSESPDCCVKVIELNPTMVQEGDTAIAQHLLVAAALQQAMGNKSAHWAPIYGLGSQGTNAFYATRLCPRSAQTLIEHRIRIDSADLKTLLLEILEGLMDLDEGFHRSHGNLKPSNILIGDRNRIRKGAVFLTDPDASNEDLPSLTRTPDSKAIGELIYALVTHKPHVTARWPLVKSSHWKRLGSTGKQWFSLCDDLLNTVSRRGLPTLDRVRDRIDAIHPTRRQVPRTVFALLLLGCLAGGAYVRRDQLPRWYQQAHEKVNHLISRLKTSDVSAHASPGSGRSTGSTTQQAKPGGLAINPAAPRTLVGSNNIVPVMPPPAVPVPVVPAPLVPVAPRPAVAVPPRVDDEGTVIVRGTLPPELHSEPARKEFIARQNSFVATYAGFGSATVLSDWARILAKIQGLETSYPPLDPVSTAGWPAGLADSMNARRNAALVRTIDAAFDSKRVDADPFETSEARVEKAATAVVAARDAMARGDILEAEKSIDAYRLALKSFPADDADLAHMFAPVNKEFSGLTDIQASNDRPALLAMSDNQNLSLAIRLAAWFRLPAAGSDAWPNDLPSLSADDARVDRMNTLLQEAGNVATATQVVTSETARRDDYFARMKDQPSVATALRDANDSRYATLLAKAPIWFRYDAALYTLKTTLPSKVTADQKKLYTDLAGQVDAPGVQLVHDVLQEAESPLPPSLAESGPGSVRGWQLRPGWTREHCTYLSPAGTDSLEFIHVHVSGDPDGIDCYLCTTETPVAMLRHLLNGNLTAFNAAETLNTSPVPPGKGMRSLEVFRRDGHGGSGRSGLSKVFYRQSK